MSELINTHDNRATIRWKLLTGVSAMALTAYVSTAGLARAEDTDRPTVWIELGGQMELMQGLSSPFTAPFMSADLAPPGIYHGSTLLRLITPAPNVYAGNVLIDSQRPQRFAFGGEGKISFQPEDSDWIFSAGIRFGRSHGRQHNHQQTPGVTAPFYSYYGAIYNYGRQNKRAFSDVTAQSNEHHLVLDFSAGKDVGIGLLGHDGTSTLNAGVRLVDLTENSTTTIYARPNVSLVYRYPKYQSPVPSFHAYTMKAHAARSFKGIGPSLSWNASAALAGNKQDGELVVDWGINAALIFGRQKAKTDHSTQANEQVPPTYGYSRYSTFYPLRTHNNPLRSRKVTVPNLGGSLGLSVNYPNFKVSVGYRGDIFFKAMDRGIDTRKDSNLTFNGPYASISIGLGD